MHISHSPVAQDTPQVKTGENPGGGVASLLSLFRHPAERNSLGSRASQERLFPPLAQGPRRTTSSSSEILHLNTTSLGWLVSGLD
eukprot:s284_g2.t1